MSSPATLVEVSHLSVVYAARGGGQPTRAVNDVSFNIGRRETLGLVGESGSGKTTIGRALLGLVPTNSGSFIFDGKDITQSNYRERRALSREIQVVFQDPYSSLNPTRTIGATLAESLRINDLPAEEVRAGVAEMLERVGLPAEAMRRYPASFSGGQRQRIAIARALIVRPKFVVCDEPVSSLDLSVQAQVLNLLRDLQSDFELSYLFIAHDLAVVRHVSHRILVLYGGRIMEDGTASLVYDKPRHPYTQALLAASPIPDPSVQRTRRSSPRTQVVGSAEGAACPFAPRCAHAIDICRRERPALQPTDTGSRVACHRWSEIPTYEDYARSGAIAGVKLRA